jgi:hypothetical protein
LTETLPPGSNPGAPEPDPRPATITVIARAYHKAYWASLGYPEPPVPWEMLDRESVAAHFTGAEAALNASGLREKLAAAGAERDKAYRERAALIAYLTANYPSVIYYDADPEAPGWPVIFTDTPAGQMSWHLAECDLGLFPHVRAVLLDRPSPWDGHTTGEKYGRLADLTRAVAAQEPETSPGQLAAHEEDREAGEIGREDDPFTLGGDPVGDGGDYDPAERDEVSL